MGARYVLNSSEHGFEQRLKALCRELGATAGFDAVAGDMPEQLLRAMPRKATVYVYGALSQVPVRVGYGDLIFRDQRVHGFYLSNWAARQHPAQLLRAAITIQRTLGSDFRSEVRACLPLEQHDRALSLYANDMTGGKVLFVPGIGR